MAAYDYIKIDGETGCGKCRKGFEAVQSMKDDPLKMCPDCGCKVRRVIGAANIATKWREKTLLSDANLKRTGFKKLTNEGDGKFHVS